jgi:hypothetical protein
MQQVCSAVMRYRSVVKLKKLNSVALVRERTIPTERPPLVDEVSANFCGKRVSRFLRNGSSRPYSMYSIREQLLFLRSKKTIPVEVCRVARW